MLGAVITPTFAQQFREPEYTIRGADILGFEIVPRNNEQLYIHLDTAHLVLKKAGSPGHDAGGPMHFAFATSTEKTNELVEKFASLDYRPRSLHRRHE